MATVVGLARGAVPEAVGFGHPFVEQHADVRSEELAALPSRDDSRLFPRRQRRSLRQDPRVAQHAAAHQDSADARAQAVENLVGLEAVAAAEDGNVEIGRHLAHEVPVGAAGIRLLGGAAVNGHRGGAGILHAAREVGRVAQGVVPARAHLDRDRNANGAGHGANHRGRVFGLAHQAAAGIVLGDLRHRAAHVDVDDVGAHALDDLCRRRHLVRVAAEHLDRDRALLFGVLGVFKRAIDAADEPLGRHHLGHDQTAAAVPFHETAERRVGHARHGRHHQRRFQVHRSDFHARALHQPRNLPATRLPA